MSKPIEISDADWLRGFLTTSGEGRTVKEFKRGDPLFKRNDNATVYLVLRGLVSLLPDKPISSEILGRDRWLFAHELGHAVHQSAFALTDCTVVTFELNSFHETLAQYPILHLKFLRDIADHENDPTRLDSTDRRLVRWLLELCGKNDVRNIETTPQKLATLLGKTRQTITTIIEEKLAPRGAVIHLARGRYQLHRGPLEKYLTDDNGDK